MNKSKTNFKHILLSTIIAIVFMTIFPSWALSKEIRSVLIISIDALHPDALGIKTTKTISKLMEKGVFTLDGNSTKPPLTLLSHAAMFSGIGPEDGGRKVNIWNPGQEQIPHKTIFDDAKLEGFTTGFFYSKEKLGYLISGAVDQHRMDPDFSVENAFDFFKNSDQKRFCFIHISGLDRVGPIEGWMSDGYMEELFFIDDSIAPLTKLVMSKKGYLIIITSDHAGHQTIHGSDHPDDAKLPLVMISDIADLKPYQKIKYHVIQLKLMLKKILGF